MKPCKKCKSKKSKKSEECTCQEPEKTGPDRVDNALILGDKKPTFEEKLKDALGQ